MNNRKSTKRALLTSLLSLLLCCSMLIGTTFAWFTDEVTSAKNQIVAGNLDIELEYSKDMASWASVEGKSDVVDPNALWEPGHTEVVYLRISNLGTLALKYSFNINFEDTVVGKSVLGNDIYLSKYLKYAVVDVPAKFSDRDAARKAVKAEAVDLAGYAVNGEMKDNEDAKVVALVIYMPEEVGNEANYRGTDIPKIEMGISLFATQLMAENDSFGNDYDADAILPWDGSADTAWYDDSKSEFVLYTAEELAGLATLINGGNNLVGKTVKLGADIDLAGRSWTPINLWFPEGGNNLTIEGDGHKISNMVISASGNNTGFISSMTGNVTIQNLTFEKASVVGSGNFIGTVVGYQYGNLVLNNVDVVNSEVYSTAAIGIRIGGLVGFSTNDSSSPATIKLENCDVSGTTIMGYHNLGGLVGTQMNTEYTYTNCSVKECNIYARTTTEKYVDEIAVDGGTFTTEYHATVENNKIVCGAISNAAQLAALSGARISGTYVLVTDIDMNGADFSAMIVNRSTSATFNGNGHTISNVNIVSGADDNTTGQASMFYAYPNSTLNVNDLILKDITVTADANGSGYAAAVIGYCEGAAVLNNVDVVNATVVGVKSSGMLVGHLSGSLTATDCDVTGTVTLADFAEEANGHYAGKYLGTMAGATALNSCTANVTVSGNLNAANDGTVYGRKTAAGSLTVDGAVQKTASTQDELAAAVGSGNNVYVTLAAGNYTMPTINLQGKELTISGTKDTVIDVSNVNANNQFVTGATIVFEGVTLNFGKVNYMGFANTASLTYKDCTINGLQFLYGAKVTFDNCVLNSNGAEHCVWTYGAQNVSFTDCDFTYGDRGINCYGDNDVTGGKQTVNFTNCTFTTENTASEGAVEINSSRFSVGIEVNMTGCTAPAYGELAYVSPWDSTNGAKTTINIK